MAVTRSELVARVESATADPADSRAARRRALGIIRGSVPFDSFAWLLTDPETLVGTSPLAEVPSLRDLPTLIRVRYQASDNWRSLQPVTTWSGPSLWRDLLCGYGVRDVATLVFADKFGCWGFLDLWRDRPFKDRELALLCDALPPVTRALRRGQAAALSIPSPAGQTAAGAAVLVLSTGLDVRTQTAESEAILRRLLPTDADLSPVPAGAYNVAAQLLAVEAGVDNHPAWARTHLGRGLWLTFRAARLGGTRESDIAVTIEPVMPRERLALFARAHGLTARETEVLAALAEGADTRAVAARLLISEFTVQDHLKSISAKTGLRTRRRLLASATG